MVSKKNIKPMKIIIERNFFRNINQYVTNKIKTMKYKLNQ